MRRIWMLAVPLVLLTIAFMVPAGDAEKFAVNSGAPWTVERVERFLPGTWEAAEIGTVSPLGGWAWGNDDTQPDQPMCYWDTSVTDWTRTCPELEPGEAIPHRSTGFAWSPTDDAFVTTTYMLSDGMRYVERLVRVDLATGNVTELFRPAPGKWIPQIAFSPDGDQIAFIEQARDAPFAIRRVGLDGEGPETTLTASDAVTLADADDLRWTATDHLLFFSGPYDSDTQGYFRVNSDGSGLARIEAVTPGESRNKIFDVTADGRYMIAEGVTETEACGRDFALAKSYVVDLERDEIAQVVCNVYEGGMPGARGANLFVTTRAVVTSEPAFLPDGSILVLAEQRAGDDHATGLAVIDVASGRISIISNDMGRDAGLWDVSAVVDDGSARVWVGEDWDEQATLVPTAD